LQPSSELLVLRVACSKAAAWTRAGSSGLRTRSVLLHNPFKVAYRRKPELHAFFRSGMPATQ
jgi:hypothetical protein